MLYKRKVSLSVQIGNIVKTYSDNLSDNNLAIDFNVTKSMGNYGDKASITVTGLTLEDIVSLSSVVTSIGKTPPPRNFISLSAGYPDNINTIYQGGLMAVSSNLDKPDMQITLECLGGFDASRTIEIEINLKPASLSVIASKLASALNMPLSFLAEDKQYKSFSFKGSCYQLINELKMKTKGTIAIYMTDGKIIVDNIDVAGSNIILVSNQSGLVGTPQASIQGVNFKTLLNPNYAVGATVELLSNKLPLLSGLYKIITLTHQGSSRGNNFFSNIFARKLV